MEHLNWSLTPIFEFVLEYERQMIREKKEKKSSLIPCWAGFLH
jgi:hypothetical protein